MCAYEATYLISGFHCILDVCSTNKSPLNQLDQVCTTNNNRLTIDFVSPAVAGAGNTGSGDTANGVCLEYRQLPC